MDKLKELREKIIEANPEIVKRSNLIQQLELAIYAQRIEITDTITKPQHSEWIKGQQAIVRWLKKDFFPAYKSQPKITLADVLMAIGMKYDGHAYIREPSIVGKTNFSFSLTDKPDIKIFWNLKQNSLDKQSPETIDFLHKLLTNKDE